ncbi:MAG: glycosyl hydrolase family 65 protein [Ilumatobacter sp.]|uniref:glycosyl hydrolase family 65 protein n=1 Tax=Ilumatobacter sp. TaxID=1967498 RepID=UPI0039188FF6
MRTMTSTLPARSDARFTDSLWVSDLGGWQLTETGWEVEHAVAVGSNFMCGNGYLGYRATWPEQRADGYVALVVSDTYDCADGHWRELTTAPNPLYVEVSIDGVALRIEDAVDVEATLDLAAGEFRARRRHVVGDVDVTLDVARFASLADLHLLGQRLSITLDRPARVDVSAGVDLVPWSLNGVHLPSVDHEWDSSGGRSIVTAFATTVESGIEIATATSVAVDASAATNWTPLDVELAAVEPADGRAVTSQVGTCDAGTLVVDLVAAVASSNDGVAPRPFVVDAVRVGGEDVFDACRDRNRRAWGQVWDQTDVVIEGSITDQAALRFSAFHNRICTPAHTDHLPIGARGLSCQAYQGAAFWDQEVYNLPAFLATDPEIARSLLVYRHRTLDGARRKAARLGYDGAYYAWISGTTGDELCPDVFFHDVLTGRPIRNHFNVWQMHIAPDIVTTLQRYLDVTDDVDFLVDHGAEIAFEVAKFLRSFVRYDDWRGTFHNIRLLGPDEWHENVDDNAFTNYQTHAALDVAIGIHERLAVSHPQQLRELCERIGVTDDDLDAWRRVRERLHLPQPDPDTGLIEQFDGFFDLEDVTPDVVRSRLLDPSEYWGWPNGVAVRTQVSKQADVAMLVWLHADRFDDAVAAANYEYYEPRCSHNSSLSHAAYGMVSARLGRAEVALGHFRATATVDLLNANHAVVAGTFIGGIHTAACAGTVQLAVYGIGGLRFDDDTLVIAPALPSSWRSISYPLRWRGQRVRVTVTPDEVRVVTAAANDAAVRVRVGDASEDVAPGAMVALGR